MCSMTSFHEDQYNVRVKLIFPNLEYYVHCIDQTLQISKAACISAEGKKRKNEEKKRSDETGPTSKKQKGMPVYLSISWTLDKVQVKD